MKNLQKYLSILLFSALLLLLSVLIMQAANTPLPQFHVQSPLTAEIEEISIFDAEDGNYYVFLPSYTNMEHVAASPPEDTSFLSVELSYRKVHPAPPSNWKRPTIL